MPKRSKNPAGLLPRQEFLHRLAKSLAVGAALITLSLCIGIMGYHWLGGLPWVDSFLDASMILSGMGPVSELHTNASKIFAGCYALYCGIALISTSGIMLAPLIHRYLHRFHLEDTSEN